MIIGVQQDKLARPLFPRGGRVNRQIGRGYNQAYNYKSAKPFQVKISLIDALSQARAKRVKGRIHHTVNEFRYPAAFSGLCHMACARSSIV
jgi:hypothetical protein